jgi:TolA-binding protein
MLKNKKTFLILLVISFLSFLVPLDLSAQTDDKELFLVAEKAFEDGFYDVAMRYIDQLLKDFPQTDKRIEANLLLGQCYFFKSQYLKAYEIFQGLLQETEFKDATLFWLGETYLKGSDYVQAEKQYKQLIELFPDSIYTPQAHYSLGWNYFEQGKFVESKEAFQKLISRFPLHQLTEDAAFKLAETEFNLKNYDDAVEAFSRFVRSYPQSTRHAEAYFYTAESYYYKEDYLTAVTYYAKAAQITLDQKLIVMCKVSMGWSYLKLEKYDLAQQNFVEAQKLAQEKNILSDDVFLGLATLYTEIRDYAKSIAAYEQLIEFFPKSRRLPDAYLGKANVFYLQKDYIKAIETYQLILNQYAKVPQQPEVFEKASFGLAWSHLKAGHIDESIKIFESVQGQTESKTVKISALTQIGDAYQDAEQFQKALDVYDSILRNYPESPYIDYVQYRQGITLLRMDKMDAATLSFQTLQTNFPSSRYIKDAKYYLAVAYLKKGDWVTAQRNIEEFIKDLPMDNEFLAESYYILGLSQFNLEQFANAENTFNKIIKNFPEQTNLVRTAEVYAAKSLYRLGNTAEAIKKFNLFILQFPQSEVAQESLIWLGDHYLSVSDFDSAIRSYEQFLKDFPGSEKINLVNYELGQAYQAKGKYEEAIQSFKQITDPSDKELYAKAKLAIAEIFSQNIDDNSAIQTYTNILATSPEFKRTAYSKIAEINKNNRAFMDAVTSYRNALSAEKGLSNLSNPEIQFAIADTFEMANLSQEAIEEYLKIPYLYADYKPWVVKAYLRIAKIFESKEEWLEAQTIYKKIVELNADESKFAQERLDWIEENTIAKTQ